MDSGGWSAVADTSIQVLTTKIVPILAFFTLELVSCTSILLRLFFPRLALGLELGTWARAWHLGLSLALGLKLGAGS
jgi:hypothetical protein